MRFRAAKTLRSFLIVVLITCTLVQALCSVDVVIVRGRVEHALINAKIRVQLVYAKDVVGESGEVTVEDGTFRIPLEFLTQSRRPVVDGLLEKCGRRPKTVIVTLLESDRDHEADRVTLNFAKGFKMADPSAYALRSDVVLNGSR